MMQHHYNIGKMIDETDRLRKNWNFLVIFHEVVRMQRNYKTRNHLNCCDVTRLDQPVIISDGVSIRCDKI